MNDRRGLRRRAGSAALAALAAVAALAAAAALVTACAEASAPAAPSSLLFVTVDTLRADHLGCYGYARDTSPRIDALAAQGTRFADATVQWPKTWPSMASFLTGAYPRTTGIRVKQRRLPEPLLLLSEILGAAGYETGAVVSNYNLGRIFGFDQGFDHFVESWQEGWQEEQGDRPFVNRMGRVKRFTNATRVTDQALAWLEGHSGEAPYFLWLHYMDPHGPYVPPPAYDGLFGEAPPERAIPLERFPPYQRQRGEDGLIRDLGWYRARYDREIRYLDDEFGRLLDTLEAWGLLEDTLVVLTADHGESLGEHEYYLEHGLFPYQPSASVPLVFWKPGSVPAGRTVQAPVGLIDVAPTVLELLGLQAPPSFEGRSLAGLLRGDPGARAPEHVFMESGYQEEAPQQSVRRGRWKLVRVQHPAERALMSGSEYELYDLREDPGELRDLSRERPALAAELAAVLEGWAAAGGSGPRGEEVDLESLDPEAREMLRALGYLEHESPEAP